MSNLPPQNATAYSHDDVQHIVAREVAKQQLIQLQNGQLELNQKLLEVVSMFDTKLQKIYDKINSTPEQVTACKNTLKQEIREDHPDRLEISALERDLISHVSKHVTEVKKEVAGVDKEIQKFKNVAYGVLLMGTIVFAMGQYIVMSTLSQINTAIDASKQATERTDSRAEQRYQSLEKRLDAAQGGKK